MTASVTGFGIMQGYLSSLDTLLPSAWTSSNPQLVGLWCQCVCKYPTSLPCMVLPTEGSFIAAVVLFFLLFVSFMYELCIRAEADRDVQAYKRCVVLVRVDLVGSQARP